MPPLPNPPNLNIFANHTEQALENTQFKLPFAVAAVNHTAAQGFFEQAHTPSMTTRASLLGTEQPNHYRSLKYEDIAGLREAPFLLSTLDATFNQPVPPELREQFSYQNEAVKASPAGTKQTSVYPPFWYEEPPYADEDSESENDSYHPEVDVEARNRARSKLLMDRNKNGKAAQGVEYDTYGELPGYATSREIIPNHVSLKEICELYPNHLVGRHLDAFIQHKWTGLDIYKLIPDKIRKDLSERGVTSSDLKNRANFLTKRLDKRMTDLGIAKMKELMEKPKLRKCFEKGKDTEGRSKLKGLYENPNAQKKRTYGKDFANKIRKSKAALKEARQQKEEELSEDGGGDVALMTPVLTPQILPSTSRSQHQSDPVSHVEFLDKSTPYVHYSAAMADHWYAIQDVGRQILARDHELMDPSQPLHEFTLLDFGLWDYNNGTKQFLDSNDVENCPSWDQTIQRLFINEFQRIGGMNGEDQPELQLQAIENLVSARKAQLRRLGHILEVAKSCGRYPIERLVTREYYGQADVDSSIDHSNVISAVENTQTYDWSTVSNDDWLAFHSYHANSPSVPRDADPTVQHTHGWNTVTDWSTVSNDDWLAFHSYNPNAPTVTQDAAPAAQQTQTWAEPSYEYEKILFDPGSGMTEAGSTWLNPRLPPNNTSYPTRVIRLNNDDSP